MSELLDRHNAVMPSWLALYYDEPIEIVKKLMVGSEGTFGFVSRATCPPAREDFPRRASGRRFVLAQAARRPPW